MPLEDWIQHCKVAQFLYDWQTVIAGVLALVAAWLTIRATKRSAEREIETSQAQTAVAQKQIETTVSLERERVSSEVDALRKSLAVEIRQYIDILITTREILRRRSGPEKRMLARDLRSVVAFHPPTVYPASADRIGLLGLLAVSVTSFYSTIERLNFTVRFLTDDPEELASRENIEAVASLLEQACRTSLPLLSELPFDERDDEFRAKIAKWSPTAPAKPLTRA
jgi:hypothetical protein